MLEDTGLSGKKDACPVCATCPLGGLRRQQDTPPSGPHCIAGVPGEGWGGGPPERAIVKTAPVHEPDAHAAAS